MTRTGTLSATTISRRRPTKRSPTSAERSRLWALAPNHVAKLTIYVVGHRVEYLPVISEARIAVFGDHKPADVIVGVETLAEPSYRIEVEALAVVD